MSESKTEPLKRITPPYGSVQWFADFFSLSERIKIEKVDAQFISNHEIAPKNVEYKVINGLRFLGLLNSDGSVTDKMKGLGVEGEPFRKNLEAIVREAYSVLFETVKDIQKAKPVDIVTCMRGDYYQMSPPRAKEGAKVFVYLAQKAGIPLSEDIVKELAASMERKNPEKADRQNTKPKEAKAPSKVIGKAPEGNYVLIPDGMMRIEYQDKVLMFLPKGERITRQLAAKIAKQFIETYEADSSEEKPSD